ncbi:MAG: class I SAM-dependent methyltransferase [Candidatus Thermoplasmatota archaeon]
MAASQLEDVLVGTLPEPGTREYAEMMHYESGDADREVLARGRPLVEGWLDVAREFEPPSMPGAAVLLAHPRWGHAIKGRVLDAGAGTCWLTARLSTVPSVTEAHALDLSPRFLTETGKAVIEHLGGDLSRVRFTASDFTRTPYPDAHFDAAWMVASIHHSRRPAETLRELHRIVKRDGVVVIELPIAPHHLRKATVHAETAERGIITERVYTDRQFRDLFRSAGFVVADALPIGAVTPPGWRRVLRRALRLLHAEDLVAPPPRVYVLTPTSR